MTGSELYTLTTELLAGRAMGETFFYQMLNMARSKREGMRPWMVLRKIDSSKTISSGDSIEDTKTLPTDFRRTYNQKRANGVRAPLILTSGNIIRYVQQIPFGTQYEHQDISDRFFVDVANSTFALTGTRDRSYTARLSYIYNPGNITASANDWVFPDEYHPILAFDVAITQKGGVDYDEINARMVAFHGADIRELDSAIVKWDDELQRSELSV